jgi:hypothetical protein
MTMRIIRVGISVRVRDRVRVKVRITVRVRIKVMDHHFCLYIFYHFFLLSL